MTYPRSGVGLLILLASASLAVSACSNESPAAGESPERFDFGDPSLEEQQLWFLINRARSDPAAEGRWLVSNNVPLVADGIEAFGVDTTQLIADFDSYLPQPPVAWEPRLARAAAVHALDQAAHRTQAHRESSGSRPADRVRAEGVNYSYLAETISSYAHSPEFGHAAFQIDWGGGPPTGVQQWPQPGHRMTIMSADAGRPIANVVGISWLPVVPADDGYGPNVVVQEFARIDDTFIVGTVWTDSNGNGVLDFGEGLDSVKVVADSGPWYTITASAGGYVLPVSQATTYTITVIRQGHPTVQRQVSVDSENVLLNIEITN